MSKLLDRLNGKGKKGPASEIPTADPYLIALRVELARLEGQQQVVNSLMNILQANYALPDRASVNPTTGVVTLPG